MKITLDVEIPEKDMPKAPYIQKALEGLNPNVSTRIVTDKEGLCNRIKESIKMKSCEGIVQELLDRLSFTPTFSDALECMCEAALFSTARVKENLSVDPFLFVVVHLPSPLKDEVKGIIVAKATKYLSTSRRLDCPRLPLTPYAETLATMVKMDLLSVRSAITAFYHMARLETTRTAGITCLGKLVEIAYEKVRQCDSAVLETVRLTLVCAQQDDFFLYDVEYIAESLGWFQNKPSLMLQKSSPHHTLPILSLAYNFGGSTGREAVVTSSAEGKVVTWDGRGKLLEIFTLSAHYASSLDFSSNGGILFVGSTGRSQKTPPAVVYYNHVDGRWREVDGVEPREDGFVTSVRALKNGQSNKYCVATSSLSNHSLLTYDLNSKITVQEYEQTDIITAVSIPSERENMILTGSRDRTVTIYDLRTRTPSSTSNPHFNCVSALASAGEYIFSAGLDRRLVVQDMRMSGAASFVREMDSAILGLSVHSVSQCAISTLTGVHTINCSSGVVPASSRASGSSTVPQYNAISWNSKGNILFAGGDTTTLDIYTSDFESS